MPRTYYDQGGELCYKDRPEVKAQDCRKSSVTSEPIMLREMRAQRDILQTRVNTLNMRIDVLRQFIALFEEV